MQDLVSYVFVGTVLVSKTIKPFVKGLDNDCERIRGCCNFACAIINKYGSQHEGNLRF